MYDSTSVFIAPELSDKSEDTAKLPDSWEIIDYSFGDEKTQIIRAPALIDNSMSKITYFTGFKTDLHDYNIPRFRALQQVGISIDLVLLPDPGRSTDFLDAQCKLVKSVLSKAPPPGHFDDSQQHYIFGHSLGARAILSNLTEPDFAATMYDVYTGGILIAPHITSPFRSNPIMRYAYPLYSKMVSNKHNGEGFLDWAFPTAVKVKNLLMRRETESDFNQTFKIGSLPPPTHGQIIHSVYEGEALEAELKDADISDYAKAFPLAMIGGDLDFVSDVEAIERVAAIFEATFQSFDAHHNPFLQSRAARQFIMEQMSLMALERGPDFPSLDHMPML